MRPFFAALIALIGATAACGPGVPRTPLVSAAADRDEVITLLAQGADPNAHEEWWTPLILAAREGHLEDTFWDRLALQVARWSGCSDVVRLVEEPQTLKHARAKS